MKLRFMSYERAEEKHPGCVLDIVDQKIDQGFPHYEAVPVSKWPVVRVWPDEASRETGDESGCVARYWLREE